MKPRFDSRLARLSEDQQAQLFDWICTIGYQKTRDRLALPEPDGFGLGTHLSCLHRFFIRYSARHEQDSIPELEQHALSDSPRVARAAERALHTGAFLLSSSPMNTEQFREASHWVNRTKAHDLQIGYQQLAQQNLALAQRRLELDTEKFRFNAARQALVHFAELDAIAKNPSSDNEDKIRAAAALLFRSADTIESTKTGTPPEPSKNKKQNPSTPRPESQ